MRRIAVGAAVLIVILGTVAAWAELGLPFPGRYRIQTVDRSVYKIDTWTGRTWVKKRLSSTYERVWNE